MLVLLQLCQPLEGTDSISETPDQGRDCALHFIDRSRECVSKATDNVRIYNQSQPFKITAATVLSFISLPRLCARSTVESEKVVPIELPTALSVA